jgi:hypothetical protein
MRNDLSRMTVAELVEALSPVQVDYYSPEHNPLGSRRQWNELCRKASASHWFACAKIGKRWLAKRTSFDAWFEAQSATPEADPLQSLAKAAGVRARRVA